MKRSKFEASENTVLVNIRNTLILMQDDPQCPPMFRDQLLAQIGLLGVITEAHGAVKNDASMIIKKGVVHEWPTTTKERNRAIL